MKRGQAPRRVVRLDRIYQSRGGVKAVVLERFEAGERVEVIAKDLTDACSEPVPPETLRQWIRRWRAEAGEVPISSEETVAA